MRLFHVTNRSSINENGFLVAVDPYLYGCPVSECDDFLQQFNIEVVDVFTSPEQVQFNYPPERGFRVSALTFSNVPLKFQKRMIVEV